MKNIAYIFILVIGVLLVSCGNNKPKSMSNETYKQYQQTLEAAQHIEHEIDNLNNSLNVQEMSTLMEASNKLYFDYDPLGMDSATEATCKQLQKRLESIRNKINNLAEESIRNNIIVIVNTEDKLLETQETFPLYLERGEKLFLKINLQKPGDIRIYNADCKSLIKTYSNRTNINDSLLINNKAIYLVEISPKGNQYGDIKIGYKANGFDRVLNPKSVEVETVEGNCNDFRVRAVKGIKMQNLFEEPRKFTLRGQLKAAFSGNYRAIVAVQVPNGATDILYSLRISTNESDKLSDGEFHDNMEISYKKIKMLGLPVYESHRSSSIISTLLGENQPIRDEDAYINVYVFYNAAQAKKFQDGADPTKLQYNIDYSKMGTQSCTDRIPTKGCKTVYLGFLNERMRYNNYVWLEAVSAVTKTEYFKEKYTIK